MLVQAGSRTQVWLEFQVLKEKLFSGKCSLVPIVTLWRYWVSESCVIDFQTLLLIKKFWLSLLGQIPGWACYHPMWFGWRYLNLLLIVIYKSSGVMSLSFFKCHQRSKILRRNEWWFMLKLMGAIYESCYDSENHLVIVWG